MKNLTLIIVIIMATLSSAFAQKLHINGYVFNMEDGNPTGIPFATVYYYDKEDQNKLEYFQFTDITGRYDLGEDVKSQDYFVKIVAPGFKMRSRDIVGLPQTFKGNLTLHYKLEKDVIYNFNKKIFTVKELKPEQGLNLIDLVCMLPGVIKDDSGNILTEDGGSVRLLLNGRTMRKDISKLSQMPLIVVDNIEYYDLDDCDGSLYQGVINIILTVGDKNSNRISFTPREYPIK